MLDPQKFKEHVGECDISTASSALTQAEGFVVSILGDIESSRKTEIYNGNGEMSLLLKRFPIVTIHSLKFSTVTVDPTTYFPQPEGVISMYTAFPRGFNVIEVDYTAGWTEATIPSSLKYAIYGLANKIMKAGDSYGSNVKSESIDGASISWGDIEKSGEEEIIKSFARINV